LMCQFADKSEGTGWNHTNHRRIITCTTLFSPLHRACLILLTKLIKWQLLGWVPGLWFLFPYTYFGCPELLTAWEWGQENHFERLFRMSCHVGFWGVFSLSYQSTTQQIKIKISISILKMKW